MAFNLADHLIKQAHRFTRTNWPSVQPFAEEVKLVFEAIQKSTTGPTTLNNPGFDPVTFPPFPDFVNDPFDFQLPQIPWPDPVTNVYNFPTPDGNPDDPVGDPDSEPPPTDNPTTDTTQTFIKRAVYPGKVLSQASGANYNVRVDPNGNIVYSTAGASPYSFNVVARLTDPDEAGNVPIGSWVPVFWVAKYNQITTTISGNPSTEFNVVDQDWVFIAPAEGGGGRVAKVTAEITARSGTTPGQGTATLYQFSEDTGTLSAVTSENAEGEEVETTVTVYNMVTSKIKAGEDKFIQVKKIDNAWFIDVEDCSSEEDEEG